MRTTGRKKKWTIGGLQRKVLRIEKDRTATYSALGLARRERQEAQQTAQIASDALLSLRARFDELAEKLSAEQETSAQLASALVNAERERDQARESLSAARRSLRIRDELINRLRCRVDALESEASHLTVMSRKE